MEGYRDVDREGGKKMTSRLETVPKEEEWRPVDGFEGIYEVSSTGKVMSLARTIVKHSKNGGCYTQTREGKQLKAHDDGRGYMHIRLYKNNRTYNTKVHRLVADAFIPNPMSLLEVNHRNGNKHDNRVENLEWVSSSSNSIHAVYELCNTKPKPKTVACVETGEVYRSCMEAQRKTGISNASISDAARGKEKIDGRGYKYKTLTAGGFHWRYL